MKRGENMKAEEAMTKSEDIHRMLLNMTLAPISTSIAAYKTAIKEITAYIDELEGKQVPKKPHKRHGVFENEYPYYAYVCGNCGEVIDEFKYEFCPNCGQAIDWEEE